MFLQHTFFLEKLINERSCETWPRTVKTGRPSRLWISVCSLVFSVCRLVTQTSNPAVTPGAPGGRPQLAETRSYVNQASLQHISLVWTLPASTFGLMVEWNLQSRSQMPFDSSNFFFFSLRSLSPLSPPEQQLKEGLLPLSQELRQARRWKIDAAHDESSDMEAKVAERLVFVMEMSVSLSLCQMSFSSFFLFIESDGTYSLPWITSSPLNIRCCNLILSLLPR